MTAARMDTVVVWNLDAQYRPELEVELDIVCLPHEIPGAHLALLRPELEVEIRVANELDDEPWFVDEDAVVADDAA
jgi:hypothetical protein